jgi:hypothetical protein
VKVDLLGYPNGRAPESSCHRGGTFLTGLSTDEPSMSMLNPPSSQKSPQLPLGRDAMTSHPLYDIHSQVPGLSHQVPGSGVQHQVQVQALFGCLSPLHFCTRLSRICTFALHIPPPATWGRHLPPETVSSPYTRYSKLNTLVSHFCTFAQEHRSDLHLCSSSSGPLSL